MWKEARPCIESCGIAVFRLGHDRCDPLTSMVKKLKLPPIIFLAKLCAAIADEAYEP